MGTIIGLEDTEVFWLKNSRISNMHNQTTLWFESDPFSTIEMSPKTGLIRSQIFNSSISFSEILSKIIKKITQITKEALTLTR